MSFITLRALFLLGFTVAISSPAVSAESSCGSASGLVANGVKATGACINTGNLRCPGKGAIFECRDGRWYCAYGRAGDPSQPCKSGEAGAWIWTANGLQKAQ
jgi:hypothetical protein